MGFAEIMPVSVRSVLRPAYRFTKACVHSVVGRHRSVQKTHEYWISPDDEANRPENYVDREARSRFLVELVRRYVADDAKILEIGCNVGRNLHYLYDAGFRNLAGVEISAEALHMLREKYPELARAETVRLVEAPIEEAVKRFGDGEFGLVFTMAVLEHIHGDSEWIFPEIVRMTSRWLITIEDEHTRSWRHFPRNYRSVFEPLGMRQVGLVETAQDGPGHLPTGFMVRVFRRD